MKYHLSKRQLKEVSERGRVLQLAIPVPSWIDESDVIRYVRDVLPVNHDWIRSAYITTLDVLPLVGDRDSLTGRLGTIVHEDTVTENNLVAEVSVVMVDVYAIERVRGRTKTQWPAGVVFDDGRRFPEEGEV